MSLMHYFFKFVWKARAEDSRQGGLLHMDATPPVLDYEELRPKAAGLLTGVDFFRIRDEACSIPNAIVTTRTQVELNLVNLKEI